MNRKEHWNRVYRERRPDQVSWHQDCPSVSLSLIEASGVPPSAGIIDVGGGASSLVPFLMEAGYAPLAVLDVSDVALEHARASLGSRANRVAWLIADVTAFVPPHRFGLWHDRAVFHFLTNLQDPRRYVEGLQRTLEPGGTAIIATFAKDGPLKCSELDVVRYDDRAMAAELGSEFVLEETRHESHVTPRGKEQRFVYFRFRRIECD